MVKSKKILKKSPKESINNSQIFVELASEVRYSILQNLLEKPQRQSKIAKKINITIQESQRQFERLSDYNLIVKKIDGTYTISNFGSLIMNQLNPLLFSQKFKEYFLHHDTKNIPQKFIVRFNELINSELIIGTFRIAEIWENMCLSTKKYMNVISTGCPSKAIEWDIATIKRGGIVHILNGKNTIMTKTDYNSIINSKEIQNFIKDETYQRRLIENIPIFIVSNENEVTIQFENNNGMIDSNYAFWSKDPKVLEWCQDLFSFWWDKSKHFEYSKLSH